MKEKTLEISGKISIIITAIGVCVIPWLVAYWQSKKKKKVQHFKEIKDNILVPIEKLLNKYTPILENKKLCIKQKIKREMNGSEIIFDDYRNKPLKEVISTEIPESLDSILKEKKVLYNDCRKNHFLNLFQKLQEFEKKFNEYVELNIRYVEKLRNKILQKVSLPSYPGKVEEENKWISGYGLGVRILEKHILNRPFKFDIKKSSDVFRLEEESLGYAQGTESEIKECVNCLRELLNSINKDNLGQIKNRRRNLKEMTEEVMAELQRIIFSTDLPGKYCDFV